MENKVIRVKEIIKFIEQIKDDESWVGSEYECYNIAHQYLNFLCDNFYHNDEYLYNRDDLLWDLGCYLDDFDEYLMETYQKDLGLDNYETDDLLELNTRIVKKLLPIWLDDCKCYCNIGALINRYSLDVDELYFDGDSNCIRDKDGNIWFD